MVTGDNLRAAGSFGSKSGLLSPTPEWPLKEFSFYGCDSKVLKNVRESVNASRKLFSLPNSRNVWSWSTNVSTKMNSTINQYTVSAIQRPVWILLFQIAIMGCSGGKLVCISYLKQHWLASNSWRTGTAYIITSQESDAPKVPLLTSGRNFKLIDESV